MRFHKTAIVRRGLSAPAKYLKENGLIKGSLLDYGCGRGYDAALLHAHKYDPISFPVRLVDAAGRPMLFDTIMCNYVLNTIPEIEERNAVVNRIRDLLEPNGVSYISVRNDLSNLRGYTKIGTWQGHIVLDLPVVTKNSNFVMYRLENQEKNK